MENFGVSKIATATHILPRSTLVPAVLRWRGCPFYVDHGFVLLINMDFLVQRKSLLGFSTLTFLLLENWCKTIC